MPEDNKYFEYALYFVAALTIVLATRSIMDVM